MRYAKALGLALLAVVALSAVMVSTASAEVPAEILPPTGGTIADVGTATFQSVGGGVVVKCTTAEGTVKLEEPASPSHFKFDVLFLTCTAGGFKCTGSKDTVTGSILVKGTIWLRAVKVGTELVALEVITPEEVEFSCLGVVTKVRGSVIGKIDNKCNTKSTTLSALLIDTEGKEEITEIEGEKFHLESSTGGGAFVESGQGQSSTVTGAEAELMC